jgi:hypothetical protein
MLSGSGYTCLLYRSGKTNALTDFIPIATKLTGTSFIDNTARPGVTYYYRVQYMSASGHLSEFSAPVMIKILEE